MSTWLMATNGNAALLVRDNGVRRAGFMPTSQAESAFGHDRKPGFSIAWHDLMGWLRDRVDRIESARIAECPVDRNLVARYLGPVFSARVLLSPGIFEWVEGRAAVSYAALFQAEDDSWRVYVMPLRHTASEFLPNWFPVGALEAA